MFRQLSMILFLLLLACPASAVCVKKDGCVTNTSTFFIYGNISDSDTTETVTAPIQAGHYFDGSLPDALNTIAVQWVPYGFTWTVKSLTVIVTALLNSTEICKIGVSNDTAGLAMEAWSAMPLGATSTATCDSTNADTDVDEVDDYCYNTDATGLVAVAGDPIYLMVDEVSAASCDKLQAVYWIMEIIPKVAAVP